MKRWFQQWLACASGFSLLELSIVMAIIGLIMTATLPMLGLQMQKQRLAVTKAHQQEIADSLALFYHQKNRLPCPAQPDDRLVQEPYGTEMGSGPLGTEVPAECLATEGMIPFRTLGMPQEMRLDGWRNLFRYSVDPLMVQDMPIKDLCAAKEKDFTLQVLDEQMLPISPGSPVVYVIASFGKNSLGYATEEALIVEGQGLSQLEVENLQRNNRFYVAGYGNSGLPQQLDHHIFWQNRDQLVAFFKQEFCKKDAKPEGETGEEGAAPVEGEAAQPAAKPSGNRDAEMRKVLEGLF